MNPSNGKEIAAESLASTEIRIPMNNKTAGTQQVSKSISFDSKQGSNSLKKTMSQQQQEPTSGIPPNPSPSSILYDFESREDYLNFGVPLYEASVTGDWETAKSIIERRPEIVRYGLSKDLGTTLHVAVGDENKMTINFVKNLVNKMTKEELEFRNLSFSNTAFWIACLNGNLEIAKIMLEKNPSLLSIRGHNELFPLSVSADLGRYSVFKYLYDNYDNMTADHWRHEDRIDTLESCVESEFFDAALQIVEDHPDLLADMHGIILGILARKANALNRVEKKLITRVIEPISRFVHIKAIRLQCAAENEEVTDAVNLLTIVWRDVIKKRNINEIEDMLRGPSTESPDGTIQYASRTLFVAAEMGNTRFIVELFRTYPDLMLHKNGDGLTIFHIAVMHRQQGIFALLYEIGSPMRNDVCIVMDQNGNNMLHLVGKSSKEMATKKSGASLLMQRELLWFKEVEMIMPIYIREWKNADGQTPHELFSKENEDLVSKGMKWMKDCMVVATLIVTVAFAVAFTVPGGYRQETGIPFFIHATSFLVFVIADAISLFSSTTSLLMFLSILVARHDQRDFMYSLPRKLMIGLVTLFVSVAAMMVTFSASFFVLYHNGLKWVPILIAAFATIPVFMFAVLQFLFWWTCFALHTILTISLSPRNGCFILQTRGYHLTSLLVEFTRKCSQIYD